MRVGLIIIEFVSVVVCTVAVFGPAPYAAGALVCEEFHNGPLRFAQAIVIIQLVAISVYVIGFGFYLDPLGMCCSPSVMQDWESMYRAAGELKEDEVTSYARDSRLGRLHRTHIGYGRIFKKFQGLLCCLNSKGNRSRTTAMREMALAFHTLFSDDDRVASDLVAGLILLNQSQKKHRKRYSIEENMEAHYLHREFSEVCKMWSKVCTAPLDRGSVPILIIAIILVWYKRPPVL